MVITADPEALLVSETCPAVQALPVDAVLAVNAAWVVRTTSPLTSSGTRTASAKAARCRRACLASLARAVAIRWVRSSRRCAGLSPGPVAGTMVNGHLTLPSIIDGARPCLIGRPGRRQDRLSIRTRDRYGSGVDRRLSRLGW